MTRETSRPVVTFANWVWTGAGVAPTVCRALLAPLSSLFGVLVAWRNTRYDRGRGVHPSAIPVVSIGNLTVGGTGKTPVAAWCVDALRSLGAHPAVVMRGVGDDEWRVHTVLNPGVPVVRSPDRVVGIATAAAQGADVAVLDDAFQHRRAARAVDLVVVSADQWQGRDRLLPSGPYREPLRALRRASAVIVTVKDEGEAPVEAVRDVVSRAAPMVPLVLVALESGPLRRLSAGDVSAPLEALRGEQVVVVSAIGNPAPLERTVARFAQRITPLRFPDHHAFTAGDVARILRASPGAQRVVCTLKDAVKLARLWPASSIPLWYVSQTVVVRGNAEALRALLDRVLSLRGIR